jgi:hypothetical protein
MPSGFIRPSFPYARGKGPTDVQYEFTTPSGEKWSVVAPLDQAVEYDDAHTVRYRFLWGRRPGDWNDQGVPWQIPR